jgi:ubiquinone/menaquinone biosynthesis C-methylase UbiE
LPTSALKIMQRIDAPEILDSDACSPTELKAALKTLGRINRWFGGVSTTQKMVERVAEATGAKNLSLLEVASGTGEVPGMVRRNLARRGITLRVALLDRADSHLRAPSQASAKGSDVTRVASDALALPFQGNAFDVVSCNLFAHHLNPNELQKFMQEGLRVCRHALLINDLVRHPLHLALVYASYPIMGSHVAWLDGLTSVRRAYIPEELQKIVASAVPTGSKLRVNLFRHFLFRMGMIVWKAPQC